MTRKCCHHCRHYFEAAAGIARNAYYWPVVVDDSVPAGQDEPVAYDATAARPVPAEHVAADFVGEGTAGAGIA